MNMNDGDKIYNYKDQSCFNVYFQPENMLYYF